MDLNDNIADSIKELAPKIYDDLASPATQETGKFLERIPRAINAALTPLDAWIAKREYNLARTKRLLEIELSAVEPEKIVTPEPYVAIPAIQALSYSIDSEELRNMYAKLLANAMTVDKKDDVHPAFVDIIKQMSPLDARVFYGMYESTETPCISIGERDVEGARGKNQQPITLLG